MMNLQDLDKEIGYYREVLDLQVAPHPDRHIALDNLATALHTRFELHKNTKDINEAIELHREALTLCEPSHPNRGMSLNNLAIVVRTRFKQQGDRRDLDEAIELHGETLTLCEPPHPNRSSALNSLANALLIRFEQQSDTRDIYKAIELYREALILREPPHPNRGNSLNNLAIAVRTRFKQQGDIKDLDEAIKLHREALTVDEPPHPNRSSLLNNLAVAIWIRFKQQGDTRNIDEAIELYREALTLHDPQHPDRGMSLNNLANAFLTRFEQQGDKRDINKVVELHREALTLYEWPHPDRSSSLNNLANALLTKFRQQGGMGEVDKAIELYREALTLREPPHPNHGMSLNNLANAVLARFEQQGDTRDIDEAIELHKEALALRELPHPDRGSSLNNLAVAVWTRFGQQGNTRDINTAIELYREAVNLCKPPHPNCGMSLHNLANAVLTRYQHLGDTRDINEAIELHRKALGRHEPHHPDRGSSLNNLAISVRKRFEQQGDIRDIDEAIELYREALTLYEPPHPYRSSSLNGLAKCFAYLYERTCDIHDLESACDLFQEAATYLSSSPLTRFRHACSWAECIAQYSPTSSLTAYHAAIRLLPQLAALHLDLPSRQQILTTIKQSSLASNAATCAVDQTQYNTAVEFLEASRSVFWSQALQLRTPLDDLAMVHPKLSARLADLSQQLELAAFRDTSRETLNMQQKLRSIESEGSHCQQLNEDWEQTIKEVQLLPGFENFMVPKAMAALQQAAVSGPIIILVATNSACFSLIVTLSSEVQYLKLPKLILPKAHFLADLSRGISDPAFDFKTFVETCDPGNQRSELEARLFAGREGSIKVDPDEVFRGLLADLWKNIVNPVFDTLKLKASTTFECKSVDPSRLWWCPIGPFAFLPLHAAGIYGKDITECASDYVVSSYTPTLTALLDPPVCTAATFKITAVIEPKAPDCPPLPGARAELNKIMARVPDQWLTGLVNTTVETALVHLCESLIVHFGCHGVQDLKQPLDSGLILTNGRLKISDIMRRPEGENALDIQKFMSVAFLSACETAKGDRTVPDEVMHLAATLLFAGFRGVVATMWTMNDFDGPKIADTFYEHLFKNCDPNSNPPVLPDLKQAAKALHLAVEKLRKEPNIPFRRWVPFVHYGL
ncbi:CHAT domain-containing protein [Mycena capillaripes]|nr:CHAT domain-containing protein [Mycena capillaripes]